MIKGFSPLSQEKPVTVFLYVSYYLSLNDELLNLVNQVTGILIQFTG